VTTVLPLTVRVVVVTVTPEALVVATEWVACGPVAPGVPEVAPIPATDPVLAVGAAAGRP
jgi:hypothetical protein